MAGVIVLCLCLAYGAGQSGPTTTRVREQAATTDIGEPWTSSMASAAPSATPSAPASTPAGTAPATATDGGTMCGDSASRAAAAAHQVDTFDSTAGGSKFVFAHYLPNLPISIDNKPAGSDYYTTQYIDPDGEGGSHRAYGGMLRDRPLPRAVSSDADWRLENLETEVRQAKSCGITGFSVDIMQTAGTEHWGVLQNLLKAADAVGGFKIMLMPDMSVLPDQGPAQLADRLATVATSPGAFRLGDGRLVVSPYMAEARSVDWWRSFKSAMADRGQDVALVPLLVNDVSAWRAFAPISYGFSNWGVRNPANNSLTEKSVMAPLGYADTIRSAGKIWMQPVSIQDERPRIGTFEEAGNTENLRKSWQIAIDTKADWVQLTTWNDYGEGSQFAPSQMHGWTNLTISQYYMKWFRTGSRPTVTGNEVFLSHRTQPYSASPTLGQSVLMHLRPNGTAARDTVEALTLAAEPSQVTVTVGGASHTCSVTAGVDSCTVPLESGKVSATLSRDGTTLSKASSPFTVTSQPKVQDLQYVAVTGEP